MILSLFAGVSAALAWSISSSIWRLQAEKFSILQLNILKNAIGALIFLPVLFSIDWSIDLKYIFLLLLSGFIGISLGDTFYFAALERLGTRRTLTVESLGPIYGSLFGILFLDENITTRLILGSIMVSLSVYLVSKPVSRRGKEDCINTDLSKNINRMGFIYAFVSISFAIIGATLSKFVLLNSSLLPIQTTEIRLISGFLPLILFGSVFKKYRFSCFKINTLFDYKMILIATFLGTNLGVYLQQYVFKHLPFGLAITLLSLSPIIAIPISIIEGERATSRLIYPSFIAFFGIWLAFGS